MYAFVSACILFILECLLRIINWVIRYAFLPESQNWWDTTQTVISGSCAEYTRVT